MSDWRPSDQEPRTPPKGGDFSIPSLATLAHASAVLLLDQLIEPIWREFRSVCERAGKSGKAIERCVISTFQIAESIGFKGDFRQWEDRLRIGD